MTLLTCCRETKSCKKLFFFTSKKPCPCCVKCRKRRLSSSSRTQDIVIELAYFSAATEYTCSGHCKWTIVELSLELNVDRLNVWGTPSFLCIGVYKFLPLGFNFSYSEVVPSSVRLFPFKPDAAIWFINSFKGIVTGLGCREAVWLNRLF